MAESTETAASSGLLSWQSLLATVATAAGGAAWVSAVGSAVIGLRLKNAHLPAESVVALMSAEHRFAIGASYLIAPLFVGLVGFLADWALTAGGTKGSVVRLGLAVGIIVVATPFGLLLLRPPLKTLFLVQNAATFMIVLAVAILTPESGRRVEERLLVFALVLFGAGVLAFGFERYRPPVFDFAGVALKGHPPVTGYYVTTTGSALILITLGKSHERGQCMRAVAHSASPRILAVPSDQIDRTLIGPAQVSVEPRSYCDKEREALSALEP